METKALNLRDLPEEFIRRVKSHAALSGMTLKDFVIEAVEKAMHDNSQTKTERKRQKSK